MPRRLKVFQAQIGFYDSVVAAPSQAAALRAWGTHLNLFADGMAREATDAQAIEAALAQPEVPLRRAVGTDDPFSLKPGLPRLPDPPASAKKAPKLTVVPREPAVPDRAALTAAEAALRRVEDDGRKERDALRQRRAELEAEEEALQQRRAALVASEAAATSRQDKARQRAERAVLREREAYSRAGGDPRPERS